MDRRRVSAAPPSHNRPLRRKKAARGLQVVERDGFWHLHGTVRTAGRSTRVRESTGFPARPDTWDEAESLRVEKERKIRNEAVYGIKISQPFSVAAEKYLTRKRRRPLGYKTVAIIQELTKKFGMQSLCTIPDDTWIEYVDARTASHKASSRERYLNTVCGFLSFCEGRGWIDAVPPFYRDKEARNPNRRARRDIGDLTADLIVLMIDHAAIHLAGQLAIEWSTGGRVSNVLHHCRLKDYLSAPGREQITFLETKNGTPVTAVVHPYAAAIMAQYLEWRGNLHERNAPLFLTHKRQPYTDPQGAWGGQNKTAFRAMKRRTIRTIRRKAVVKLVPLRHAGQCQEARLIWAEAQDKCALIARVTQHWFRHLLATNMLQQGADLRSVMAQGGWLDMRSVIGYAHDVELHRRRLVNELPIGTTLTHEPLDRAKKFDKSSK